MIVLLGGIGPLLLRDIVRNADGTLKSGFVVNGSWRLEIRGGEYLCKAEGGHIVTRYAVDRHPATREVEVPASMRPSWRNYNEVITWAEKQ